MTPSPKLPTSSVVQIIGGQRRELRVTLDAGRLAAYALTPLQVAQSLEGANRKLPAGEFTRGNQQIQLEAGQFLTNAEDVRSVVVGAAGGKPVFVRDVAQVTDGGEEPSEYVSHIAGGRAHSAVTLAISKRKGTNAVTVAEEVLARVRRLEGQMIPADVHLTITRHYGETAKDKSNELLEHMLIAVISVSALIALTLGWRGSR